MYYLDASACVALLTPESGTGRVNAWCGTNESPIATSSWVHTEVCSALSIKVRTGSLTPEQRLPVMVAWIAFRSGLHPLPIADAEFSVAAKMAERHDLVLRAGDALHLAVCAANGCTLVTLDERMAKAALGLGVPVAEIGAAASQ